MGQGCSSCLVGNPCTDPGCSRFGSKQLRKLLEEVREKYEDVQDGIRSDERNEIWLAERDQRFLNRTSLTREGFRYHASNVYEYFNTPQPKIDDLDSVEFRLKVCLDTHKEGEYLDCSNNARELMDLASAGREHPAHCLTKPNPYACTYGTSLKSGDAGLGGLRNRESQPFGSCYA